MKQTNRKIDENLDPYEDIIRFEKLDPYETLIQSCLRSKRKEEIIE
tara:strand:+ start:2138 stop:2275 length:138 start_codon:yes stop_codon:yes gene_type:complete